MKCLGQLIGQLEGRAKIDLALEVAERVAVTGSRKALEDIADSYIARIKEILG